VGFQNCCREVDKHLAVVVDAEDRRHSVLGTRIIILVMVCVLEREEGTPNNEKITCWRTARGPAANLTEHAGNFDGYKMVFRPIFANFLLTPSFASFVDAHRPAHNCFAQNLAHE